MATAGYLAFIAPCNAYRQRKQYLITTLVVGARVKTYAGDIGTIRCIHEHQLTIFFDNGNRKILHTEHIVAVIND